MGTMIFFEKTLIYIRDARMDFCQARPSLELKVRSLKWLLEPPCHKKWQIKVPVKNLVWRIGDL
jgi:hypothetical protein